jgi:hypothetical protein
VDADPVLGRGDIELYDLLPGSVARVGDGRWPSAMGPVATALTRVVAKVV